MTTPASKETRAKLIAAAEEAFAERGLDKPTLNEISERAGFTRGAFHAHFDSRDELLVAVIDKSVHEYLEKFIPKCNTPEDFARIIADFVEHSTERRAFFGPAAKLGMHQLAYASVRAPVVRDGLTRALGTFVERIAEGIELARGAGLVRTDVTSLSIARSLAMTILGVQSVLDAGIHVSVDDIAATTRTLLTPPR